MQHGEHTDSTPTVAGLVTKVTGASPTKCYQCGRCAAGCPQNVAGEMDISPTRIMHLLQMEQAFATEPDRSAEYANAAMSADTPWLCAGCQACTTRCPQEVDIAGTMDVLRQEAMRRGLQSKSKRARDIQALHKVFLKQALKRGRLHELSMIIAYKMRTGHLLADASLGPGMLKRGKMHIFGGESADTTRVQNAIDELKK